MASRYQKARQRNLKKGLDKWLTIWYNSNSQTRQYTQSHFILYMECGSNARTKAIDQKPTEERNI